MGIPFLACHFPNFINTAVSECGDDAKSSVHGGGSAKADDEFSAAILPCMENEFTSAECICLQGISLFWHKQLQATGLGEFNDGSAVWQEQIAGGDFSPQRVMAIHHDSFCLWAGECDYIQGALATVRKGQRDDLCIWQHFADCLCLDGADLRST